MNKSFTSISILKKRKIIIPVLSIVFILPIIFYSLSKHNDDIDFNTEIRPIINGKCITCHGGVKRAGGFSLLFRSDALGKTESGKPAIVPGSPDESEFIKRLTHHDVKLRMPLNGPRLSEEEISKLRKWITQGAKWADHWAYVKPKAFTPPSAGSSWAHNDIDRFVYAKLEQEGLKPSAEADKATLIRRVSLDLTGLPPGMDEVIAFQKDQSHNAYEKVVDRLLASPRYGERWASMWMDLARYADTKGYEKDQYRSIWPYRDWVINAFNNDKPFNEFTIEQLAGDLLPTPSQDQLVATGFHRNTLTNDEDGTDPEEFRIAAVLDRVNTTWEVWQSTTIGCVQCHSHPYDPFRHEEYYKFMSFFNNTEDEDRADDYPYVNSYSKDQEKYGQELLSWIFEHDKKLNTLDLEIKSTDEKIKLIFTGPEIVEKDEYALKAGTCNSFKGLSIKKTNVAGYIKNNSYLRFNNIDLSNINTVAYKYTSGGKGGFVEIHTGSVDGPIISKSNQLVNTKGWDSFRTSSNYPVKKTKGKHDLFFVFTQAPDGNNDLFDMDQLYLLKEEFNAELNSKKEILAKFEMPSSPIMRDRIADSTRKTFVFIRGNWKSHGKEVKSDVPGSMNAMKKDFPKNRLGMAKWLVSQENPLTARVIINRFWEQLYGTGLVETLEDFGTQGMKPSHPELLDWLAVDFMEKKNWSIKKMLKEVVMSSTYRQSSVVTVSQQEKDPRNRLLSRGPRVRLSAEQVRDQALAVSGLLSKDMFGKSVMPAQPAGIWSVPYSSVDWTLSPGDDRYRRALYTYWRRSSAYPSMITFDSPDRNVCVSRRIRTNTPLQALVTLNDTVYMEAARVMAMRMINEGGKNIQDQIIKGYKLALAKEPKKEAVEVLYKLHTDASKYYINYKKSAQMLVGQNTNIDETKLAPMTVVANAILNLDEFIMKE